jgi:hypothetical protein
MIQTRFPPKGNTFVAIGLSLDFFRVAQGMVRGQKKGSGHPGADPFLVQTFLGVILDGTGRTGANAAI